MYKTKINLITLNDIHKFVNIVSQIPERVVLTDGFGYTVNAKSIIGCIAALEWNNLYVTSETDIYTKIAEFAAQ